MKIITYVNILTFKWPLGYWNTYLQQRNFTYKAMRWTETNQIFSDPLRWFYPLFDMI